METGKPTAPPPPDLWPDLPFPWLKIRWVQHLLFWLVIIFMSSVNWRAYNVEIIVELAYYSIHIFVCALVIYFNFYYLLPRYLLRGKIWSYGLLFLASLILGAFLRRAMLFYLLPYYFPETQNFSWATRPLFDFRYLVFAFVAVLSVVTFASMIKLGKMWYQKELASRILQQEKLRTELRYLKNQINPHFFFNTLNNLYALTLKKSDHAPEVVMGLSALMDYLLYESNADYMPLEKEINILENYISLEKIRHEAELKIAVFLRGSTKNYQVAPLLFLPFVENAFKHGVGEKAEEAWINIELETQNQQIIFKVENSKSSPSLPGDYTLGIGLQNVQKRLALIYKERYDLQFFDEEDTFLVVLKIDTRI